MIFPIVIWTLIGLCTGHAIHTVIMTQSHGPIDFISNLIYNVIRHLLLFMLLVGMFIVMVAFAGTWKAGTRQHHGHYNISNTSNVDQAS